MSITRFYAGLCAAISLSSSGNAYRASEDVVNYALTKQAPELADRGELIPFDLAQHDVHMAVRKDLPDHTKVVSDVNRVLAEMRADGSLDALIAKHR